MHKGMSNTGMSVFYAVNGTFLHRFLHEITDSVTDLTKWVDRFQSSKRLKSIIKFGHSSKTRRMLFLRGMCINWLVQSIKLRPNCAASFPEFNLADLSELMLKLKAGHHSRVYGRVG